VRIAIDPALMERHGPEVCWTWRLLLSGMGLPWEEVPWAAECDIAHGARDLGVDRGRIYVPASLQGWDDRTSLRLASVCEKDEARHPLYAGAPACSGHFRIDSGRLVCERDLVLDVFWLATGQEERHWPRNRFGHFDLGQTGFDGGRVLRRALASSIGAALETRAIELGLPAPLPRWPGGKRAAACVGHDVDYPEIVRWLEPARIVRRQGAQGIATTLKMLWGGRHHWHFDSWVGMERGLGVRSAFYFVPRRGSLLGYAAGTPDPFYDVRSDRFRSLFAFLVDAGVEIGLQASYRSYQGQEVLAAQKRVLEDACGQAIAGNRHHYWHLDPRDPEATLLLHEKVGLEYDSSLVHERYVGWRRGLCWPHFPFHQALRRELKTLQMSVAWMDDQLFGYQRDNPGDRLEMLRELADETARQGGCLVLDVHDYVFDSVLFPGWASTYRSLLEDVVSRSDFWVATPAEIADHWTGRHASIAEASEGLTGALCGS
jgi:hypothetical protein